MSSPASPAVPPSEFNPNEGYRYRRMPLDVLRIHPGYQRDASEPRFKTATRRIVDRFDPRIFHALDVAEYKGKFYVVDGQGRLAAVKILYKETGHPSFATVWCKVFDATPEEQATLFVAQVDRRQVTSLEQHKARLFSGARDAVEVQEVVDALGLVIGRGKAKIGAVAALYWVWEMGGQELLMETLTVLQDATWLDGKGVHQYGSSDRIIKPMGRTLELYPAEELDRGALAAALAGEVPAHYTTMVTNDTSSHGSNNVRKMGRLFVREYNRATGRRLRYDRIEKSVRKRNPEGLLRTFDGGKDEIIAADQEAA